MKFKFYGKAAPPATVAQSDLPLKDSFELSRSRSSEENAIEVEVNEDDILELNFANGSSWLLPPEDLKELLQEQATRSASDTDSDVIELPIRLSQGTAHRGAVGDLILKALNIFEAPISKLTAQWVASSVEGRIIPEEGLFFLDKDFSLTKRLPDTVASSTDADDPLLLFIHGTGSNTEGSFGSLRNSHVWSSLWQSYQGQVMAFEHFTLSKSPIDNVRDLLPLLPAGRPIHMVTHSRGGIVGDFLARAAQSEITVQEIELLEDTDFDREVATLKQVNKLLKKHQPQVDRYVRVACPSQGTRLMTERLDVFLNVLLNLLTRATGGELLPPVKALKELLLAVVKQRANPDALPGLAAMKPDTAFQDLLNYQQEALDSPLNIISGTAQSGKWKETLAFFITRVLFWRDNDWVVDTEAMFSGFQRQKTTYYRLFSGGDINHFAYFQHPDSQLALLEGLKAEAGNPPKGFKPVVQSRPDTDRGAHFPNGNISPLAVGRLSGTKPVVVLVPGIMGSNLALNDEEIWIEYRKIAAGNLLNLTMKNNAHIKATSLVATPYEQVFTFLKREGYEVIVFPFDWRLSTSISGALLAQKIEEIRATKNPPSIQVVAHSMGGLVARAMMLHDGGTTWNRLREQQGPALIMLGTPWRGSYLMAQTLTGYGKTIRSLAKLSIGPRKHDLLKVFSKYPGLYELLPLQGHEFEEQDLWKTLQKISNKKTWVLPTKKQLEDFHAFKEKTVESLDKLEGYDKIIYVAGHDEETVDNIAIKNGWFNNRYFQSYDHKALADHIAKSSQGDQMSLVFTTTSEGDGSVSWDLGVPADEQGTPLVTTYYQDTTHGELANDERHFDALAEALKKGKTKQLKLLTEVREAARSRSVGRPDPASKPRLERPAVLADSGEGLVADVLGMSPVPRYDAAAQQKQTIEVSVKMGHLKYAQHPILVGHFREQSLRGVEYVLDVLLEGELRKRHSLGNYPGNLNTNLVLLSDGRRIIETIVAGIGSPEDLTPLHLTQTVEQACREYIIEAAKSYQPPRESLGITPLLIGTAYGMLNLAGSINAVLEGVSRANAKVQSLRQSRRDGATALPFIDKVEFIEIYRDKAMQTFYILDQIERENNIYSIRFDRKLYEVEGSRDLLQIADEQHWWMRLNVRADRDYESGLPIFRYSASTGHARVSDRTSTVDPRIIHKLLDASDYKTEWNRSLSKTLFELLVPNEFKLSFRNQHNILLILDQDTACYPWELLHFEEDSGDPLCVRTGFIRQLATSYDRPIIKPIHRLSALVIGDPQLTGSRLPQLPGAKREAQKVAQLLKRDRFAVDLLTEQKYDYILTKFFEEYKILHIASHGVVDYEVREEISHMGRKEMQITKRTGILLDDQVVLDPAVIAQRSSTPELVFINCCHLGEIDADKERYFQQRHRLAANVGTEFIHMGVKAVVVAGWAVNDDAAEVFATIFYQQMLSGVPFGRAVKEAREQCYRRFPNTHTWGAYQCYGDEDYQLVSGGRQRNSEGISYLLSQEAIIDLEKLLDETTSIRKRHKKLDRELQTIIDAVELRNLRTPRITEMEAAIYAEIGDYEQAVYTYEQLWKAPQANWSFRSLEQYYDIQMAGSRRRWHQGKNDKERKKAHKEILDAVKNLRVLLRLAATTERLSLMGVAYKRLFLTAMNAAQADKYLDEALAFYDQARLNVPNRQDAEHYPALTNWLGVALVQDDDDSCHQALGYQPVASYFNDELEELREKSGDRAEFVDEVRLVNVLTVLLLAESDKEKIKPLEDEIIKHYGRAWRRGGSIRDRESECLQMSFLLRAIERAIEREEEHDSAGSEVGGYGVGTYDESAYVSADSIYEMDEAAYSKEKHWPTKLESFKRLVSFFDEVGH